jgi:hypothetical protein
MTFRNREAARIFALRQKFFSSAAADSLRDGHHFGAGYENENILGGFREAALEFFASRRIKWHGGLSCDSSIVSSQVACLNCFFPFVSDSSGLRCWLSKLYPNLDDVLPISSVSEPPLPNGKQPLLTFEWIGERSYLKERWGSRGQNCTNVDVLFRYRSVDCKIHLVLVEWKYCESYDSQKEYIRRSRRGTDRVAIYRPELDLPGTQIVLGAARFEDLFFEPIDQIMRLQLLASAMERHREMAADVVSVLHIAPRSNERLLNNALSARIASGSTVGEVWRAVAADGRFKTVATEDLVPLLCQCGTDKEWAEYIQMRYGAMA